MALAMENSKKICKGISVLAVLLLIAVSCNSRNAQNKIIINKKEMEQNSKETHNVFNPNSALGNNGNFIG